MISIGLSLLAVKWLDIHIRSDRPSITVHSVLRASRRFPPPSLPPFPSSFSTPGETANQSPPPSSSWSTKLSCGQASPTPSSTPRRRQSNRFLKIHNRGTNEAFGLFLPPSLPPSLHLSRFLFLPRGRFKLDSCDRAAVVTCEKRILGAIVGEEGRSAKPSFSGGCRRLVGQSSP